MPVEVHVSGRIERGRFAEFLDAATRWRDWRREDALVAPRILQAISGEMNTVLMVFSYGGLGGYEEEEARVAGDREYARVATAMPFEGPLTFTILRDPFAASADGGAAARPCPVRSFGPTTT